MPTWYNENREQKCRDVAYRLFVDLVNEYIYDPICYEDFFFHYDPNAPRRRLLGVALSCGSYGSKLREWIVDS